MGRDGTKARGRGGSAKLWLGVALGAVGAALVALGVAASGLIDMSAASGSGVLGDVGAMMWERSLAWRAPQDGRPIEDASAAAEAGFEHYKSSCVLCHGAPGVDPAEFSRGLEPPPPDLAEPPTQARPPGELFHIVHAGVQMTGMPAFGGDHDEREIWELVAFIQRIDSLRPDQVEQLREQVRGLSHRHGGGHHGEPTAGMRSPETQDAARDHEGDISAAAPSAAAPSDDGSHASAHDGHTDHPH